MRNSGATEPPGGAPRRVLTFLRRLPEREVARVLFQRTRVVVLELVGPLSRERPIGRETGDSEVDVAAGLVCMTSGDELFDQRHDLGDRLGGKRLRVRHLEPERRRVLEVPPGGLTGSRSARARSGLIDLVVDVGDVVDVRDVIAALAEPVSQPGEDDEGHRVPDVGPLVHGGATDVHPHL